MLQWQWCNQGQNLKANTKTKTKASTLKAKANVWTVEAKVKAIMHTAGAEIKIRSTCIYPDGVGNEQNFDCFCLFINISYIKL